MLSFSTLNKKKSSWQLAFTWAYPRQVCSLSFHMTLDVCILRRSPMCRPRLRARPSPYRGRFRQSAPCATLWTCWCPWDGSPSERPQLSVGKFAQHLSCSSRSPVKGDGNLYELHKWHLTVTPAMTGAFPSISLKTSASASSPVLSLYFFWASSPRAALNSSNVMVREDFFLKYKKKKQYWV